MRRLDIMNIPIFNLMKHFASEKWRFAKTNLLSAIIHYVYVMLAACFCFPIKFDDIGDME